MIEVLPSTSRMVSLIMSRGIIFSDYEHIHVGTRLEVVRTPTSVRATYLVAVSLMHHSGLYSHVAEFRTRESSVPGCS